MGQFDSVSGAGTGFVPNVDRPDYGGSGQPLSNSLPSGELTAAARLIAKAIVLLAAVRNGNCTTAGALKLLEQ